MADRSALTDTFLMAFAPESTKLRGAAGAYFTPKGIASPKVSNPQAPIASKAALSARKRRRTAYIGEKSYQATLSAVVGDTFQADWDKAIKAAMGGKITDVALVESAPTATGFSFTGGPPMPIVLVTRDTGLVEALPVNSQAAGAATFGLQPVLGGDTITDVQNPVDVGGAIYYIDPTYNTDSFQIQSKYANEPDSKTIIGLGAHIAKLMLKVALQDVLYFDMEFNGVDWYEGFGTYGGVAYADNTADPGDATNQFLSHQGVIYCQETTPAAVADIEASGIEFDLAPTFKERRAIIPRMPSGTLGTGSSVASKRFGIHFENGITVHQQFHDPTWATRRKNKTQLQLFFEFYNGAPGVASTKRIAGWFPLVEVSDEPASEENDGLLGNGFKFNVGERTLTGMQLSPFYLAFFGA